VWTIWSGVDQPNKPLYELYVLNCIDIYTVYNYIYMYIIYMYNDMYILGLEWKNPSPFHIKHPHALIWSGYLNGYLRFEWSSTHFSLQADVGFEPFFFPEVISGYIISDMVVAIQHMANDPPWKGGLTAKHGATRVATERSLCSWLRAGSLWWRLTSAVR
jgi:hypothetical protein